MEKIIEQAVKAAQVKNRQRMVRRCWRLSEVRKRAENRRAVLHDKETQEDHVSLRRNMTNRLRHEARMRIVDRFRYFRRHQIFSEKEPPSDEKNVLVRGNGHGYMRKLTDTPYKLPPRRPRRVKGGRLTTISAQEATIPLRLASQMSARYHTYQAGTRHHPPLHFHHHQRVDT